MYGARPDWSGGELDWLVESQSRPVGREDALAAKGGDRHVVITFDDGDVSNVEVALPMLRERGFHAEFYVTSDFIGQPGMLPADGVRELAAHGMGIG